LFRLIRHPLIIAPIGAQRQALLTERLPINRFITETNDKPKPFIWTKSADAILVAVNRARQALEAIPSHVRLSK
jgi:hypothetical protein